MMIGVNGFVLLTLANVQAQWDIKTQTSVAHSQFVPVITVGLYSK